MSVCGEYVSGKDTDRKMLASFWARMGMGTGIGTDGDGNGDGNGDRRIGAQIHTLPLHTDGDGDGDGDRRIVTQVHAFSLHTRNF